MMSSYFPKALNGATIVDIRGTTTDKIIISKVFNGHVKASSTDKIIIVLPTWEDVTELQPRMDDISRCPGKLIIVTASAPQGSDSVCGSAHCALAHYWSLKMNKCDFVAYAVTPLSLAY
ncbi:unnamed protein product [Microthlaspi erraticum]|uniref:Uncharacterized protein n=1 Tax=Microthlaspi erraticum TaxID=1685480 RepID=A0A6D2KCB3_9BRAS|nr:unnamed protein product [Microthlaspi erraticum]CAA7056307.1 unnamed protein product [Microthlaspi erraticum]